MASSRQSSPTASNCQSNSSSSSHQSQVVVVMITFPGQGHLNQLLHLSRLILSHGIPVHYVGTATHNRQVTVRVQGWDPKSISTIHFHNFNLKFLFLIPLLPTPMKKPDSHLIWLLPLRLPHIFVSL